MDLQKGPSANSAGGKASSGDGLSYLLDKSLLIDFSEVHIWRDSAAGCGEVSLAIWKGMSVAILVEVFFTPRTSSTATSSR